MKLVLDIRYILDLLDLVSFIRTRYKISLISDIDRNSVALIYVQIGLSKFFIFYRQSRHKKTMNKKNDPEAKLIKATRFYDR